MTKINKIRKIKQEEIKKIMKQKKMLNYELKTKLKERVVEVLGNKSVENGCSLIEMTGEVLNKTYVSGDDKKLIYQMIISVRKDTDKCLAYRNGKYGWAKTKEDIDVYRIHNVVNGLQKIKSNIIGLPKNYKAIGIKDNPYSMLNSKVREYGIKFIDYTKMN